MTDKILQPARYVIPGATVPLARPRLSSSNHVYDSQKDIKRLAGTLLKTQHNERSLFLGPLHVQLDFFMPMVRSSVADWWMPKRPDIDNLAKFVLDVANGILYEDDNQVVSLVCKKRYGKEPRTEIIIRCLKELWGYII